MPASEGGRGRSAQTYWRRCRGGCWAGGRRTPSHRASRPGPDPACGSRSPALREDAVEECRPPPPVSEVRVGRSRPWVACSASRDLSPLCRGSTSITTRLSGTRAAMLASGNLVHSLFDEGRGRWSVLEPVPAHGLFAPAGKDGPAGSGELEGAGLHVGRHDWIDPRSHKAAASRLRAPNAASTAAPSQIPISRTSRACRSPSPPAIGRGEYGDGGVCGGLSGKIRHQLLLRGGWNGSRKSPRKGASSFRNCPAHRLHRRPTRQADVRRCRDAVR